MLGTQQVLNEWANSGLGDTDESVLRISALHTRLGRKDSRRALILALSLLVTLCGRAR